METRCENNSLIMILAPRDDRFEVPNLVADRVSERTRERERSKQERRQQKSRRVVRWKE